MLALPFATRVPAFQSFQETKLAAAEEHDAYEIYSMLLRKEMNPSWKVAAWTIIRQTHTYPNVGSPHNIRQCLGVPRDQETIYLPLIDAYTARNNGKLVLDAKFDLPRYELVDSGTTSGRSNAAAPSATFVVSAIGFNSDRTRALLYVGHYCGSLCGGGTYHPVVKKDGIWQVDGEFRGMTCLWVS
jgi:hypothetical protein